MIRKIPLKRTIITVLATVLLAGLYSCAGRVPVEVVDLSGTIGKDIDQLHLTYKELIIAHFQVLREQRQDFISSKWLPAHIERLMALKNKQLNPAYNPDTASAISNPVDIKELMEVAAKHAQRKQEELISPVNEAEKKLLEEVDQAFDIIKRANGKVTDYLGSLKKIGESREEIIKYFNIQDLRGTVNKRLGTATSSFPVPEVLETEKETPKSTQSPPLPVLPATQPKKDVKDEQTQY